MAHHNTKRENVIASACGLAIPLSGVGDCFDLRSRSDMNQAIFKGELEEWKVRRKVHIHSSNLLAFSG